MPQTVTIGARINAMLEADITGKTPTAQRSPSSHTTSVPLHPSQGVRLS